MNLKEILRKNDRKSNFNVLTKDMLSKIKGAGGNSCGSSRSSSGCDSISACGTSCGPIIPKKPKGDQELSV